jgi:type VI secretion system secreted protein VgrG
MPPLLVTFDAPALDRDQFRVLRAELDEELSSPYEVRLELAGVKGARIDDLALIGTTATLELDDGSGEPRRIPGVVTRVSGSLHEESGSLLWKLVLHPRMESLSLTHTTEVVQDASVPEIVRERLARLGMQPGRDFELSLSGDYPARDFVVQYRETDLGFVRRLLEHEGIAFCFREVDGRDVVLFTDDNAAIQPGSPLRAQFRPRGERTEVYALALETSAVPRRVLLRDYNYRTPKVNIESEADLPGRLGTTYEFGNHAKTPGEAARLARVRAEEVGAKRRLFTAQSSLTRLTAGAHLQLAGHPIGDLDLLVVSVRHRVSQAHWSDRGQGATSYENTFTAIPVEVPFRPARKTPKPVVAGVISGVVEAAQEGDYAELDGDGRYHIRFLFDRRDVPRGRASRPVRMAQPHAGPGYGLHFPLRDGVEVVLSCVEGDPDRPIISGAIANPTTPSPVTEKNAVRNVIRTGGGTEINIDDSKDGERLKITVPFGQTLLQLGAPNDPTPGAALKTNKNIALASGEGMSLDDDVEIKGHAPHVELIAKNTAYFSSGTETVLESDANTIVRAPLVERHATTNLTTSTALTSSVSQGMAILEGASSVSVGSDGIVVVSAPTIILRADLVKVAGAATVDVAAPAVTVAGSGTVNVNGGEVTVSGSVIKLNA